MKYKIVDENLMTILEDRLEHLILFTNLMEQGVLYEEDEKIKERDFLKKIISEFQKIDKKYSLLADKYVEKDVMTFSNSSVQELLRDFAYTKTPVDEENTEFYVRLTGKLPVEKILELDKFMEG